MKLTATALRPELGYFQPIAHLRASAVNGVRGQLKDAGGLQRDLGNTKRAQVLFDMDDFFFLAEKNEIDGKHHADGMDTPGGDDPKTGPQPCPAFGFSQEPDQPTQIAIRYGCFRGDECFPRFVVDKDCTSTAVISHCRRHCPL